MGLNLLQGANITSATLVKGSKQMNDRNSATQDGEKIAVWDPLVRIFHWSLVVVFFTAYFTDDEVMALHVWAGYAAGGLIVFRIVWGLIGSKHARFSDFIAGPLTVWTYLINLLSFRSKRHLGHSPAGGAMVFALLAAIAATVWSGLELHAIENKAGPLASAPAISFRQAESRPSFFDVKAMADERKDKSNKRNDDHDGSEDFWEEVHEALANFTLALVILHIAGVFLASIVHRENLTRAMFTGKKRKE